MATYYIDQDSGDNLDMPYTTDDGTTKNYFGKKETSTGTYTEQTTELVKIWTIPLWNTESHTRRSFKIVDIGSMKTAEEVALAYNSVTKTVNIPSKIVQDSTGTSGSVEWTQKNVQVYTAKPIHIGGHLYKVEVDYELPNYSFILVSSGTSS